MRHQGLRGFYETPETSKSDSTKRRQRGGGGRRKRKIEKKTPAKPIWINLKDPPSTVVMIFYDKQTDRKF